jgi:uncharacterized protein (DUF1778 family)
MAAPEDSWTAVSPAQKDLADRRAFHLDDAAWTEFLKVLDRSVSHKPRLQQLFTEASVFDEL